MSSCSSNKPVVYVGDMQRGVWYPAPPQVETRVSANDCIEIIVSAPTPELAIPFNNRLGNVEVSERGEFSSGSNPAGGGLPPCTYRVDSEGFIAFPVVGRLHVADLTLREVEETVKKSIVSGDYILHPAVTARMVSFSYTVLGAVAKNGRYEANGDRVTILEALAVAGDLTAKARPDRVIVIREENGARVAMTHDLQSREIFDSPFFYLKPNDVVYVEPRYGKKDGEDRGTQYTSILLSGASVLTSLLWIFVR